ncbi:hypothetical protein Y032_0016g3065 [Ancylostoma ceylanicum]|uniref:Uncharacterized protein n=1 Tax=Ancylostoma ceylanicum TaxID=53326 RepID=A0A016V5Q8_9BILA|nr:hypothetical protein Y032_0016g3065 [Ancylostoma ceylanicum]
MNELFEYSNMFDSATSIPLTGHINALRASASDQAYVASIICSYLVEVAHFTEKLVSSTTAKPANPRRCSSRG